VSQTVQSLKKVTLFLQAGSKADTFSLTPSPVSFEFIYGIAREGLTAFEVTINNKHPGDITSLTVLATEAQVFFGNLFMPLRQTLSLHLLPEKIFLQVEVVSVVDADNREVVKSLADSLGHGCGGGTCDCG